jgi:hypothetical protein
MLKNISLTIDIMTVDEAKEAYQEFEKVINEHYEKNGIHNAKYLREFDLVLERHNPELNYIQKIGREKFDKLSESWMNLMYLNNLDSSYYNQKIDVHMILTGREK